MIVRAHQHQLVKDTEDGAVIAGPAELGRMRLLRLLVVKDPRHISLHNDDSASVLSISIHRNKVLLGVQRDKFDLAEGD